MRRLVLAVVSLMLLAAGCASSSTPTAAPAAQGASAPADSSSPALTAAASPSPAASCALPNGRDLIVRYIVPGVVPAAQVVGEVDLANCTTTLDDLEQTSPTGAGDCTQAGWVDQNPGYNADATPAPPLKKVVEAIGPGC